MSESLIAFDVLVTVRYITVRENRTWQLRKQRRKQPKRLQKKRPRRRPRKLRKSLQRNPRKKAQRKPQRRKLPRKRRQRKEPLCETAACCYLTNTMLYSRVTSSLMIVLVRIFPFTPKSRLFTTNVPFASTPIQFALS